MDRQDQTSRHQGMATSRDGTPPSRRTPPLHGTPPQHRNQPPFTQPRVMQHDLTQPPPLVQPDLTQPPPLVQPDLTQPPPHVWQPDLTQPPPHVWQHDLTQPPPHFWQPDLTQPPPPVLQPDLTQPPPHYYVMPQQSTLPQDDVMLDWLSTQHDVTLRTSTRTEGHHREEWQNNDIQEIENDYWCRKQRFKDRDFQATLMNRATTRLMISAMRNLCENYECLIDNIPYGVEYQARFTIPALNDNTDIREDQWRSICHALLNMAREVNISLGKSWVKSLITRDLLSLKTNLNKWHSEQPNIIFELLLNILFLPSRFNAPDTEYITREDQDHAQHMLWQAMDILITYPNHHYAMLFVPGTSNPPLRELAASDEWRYQPSHDDLDRYRTAMLDAEAEDLDVDALQREFGSE